MPKKFLFFTVFSVGILLAIFLVVMEENSLSVPVPDPLPEDNPVFIAAGVPKPLGETRNYEVMLSELKSNGIEGFFPTSQYQETPEFKALGSEEDFLPPCTAEDIPYKAIRARGVKLLIWGEVLYPADRPFPSVEKDSLRMILECAGREHVLGVMSYDEPWWRNLFEPSRKLYQRVKETDPSLPVFMVHGPLPAVSSETGTERPVTPEEVQYYFNEVKKYEPYADIHGFDIYPIPAEIAKMTTPYRKGVAVLDHRDAVADYLKWLRANMGGKPYFIVLQAFGWDDVHGKWLGQSTKGVRKPTMTKLKEMVETAKSEGSSYIMWWGQSFLVEDDLWFWKEILEVSKAL